MDPQSGGVSDWINSNPTRALLIAAGVIIAIVFVLYNKNKQANTPTVQPGATAPTGATSGTADANTLYVPTSETFINANSYKTNTTVGAVTTDSNNPVTNNPPPTIITPIIQNSNPVTQPVNAPITTPIPIKVPTPTPVTPINHPVTSGGWMNEYTVVSGDTLSGIAYRHGTTWQNLYAHDKGVIDSTAIAHGMQPAPLDGYAHWIFPGERIQLP